MKSLEKFIKKYRLWWAIGIIVLGTVTAIVTIKIQKKYDENPGLVPPKKNYDIDVKITPEQEMEYETNVIEFNRKIEEFLNGTGNNGKDKPKEDRFIEKAKNLKYMWKYSEAIEAINEASTIYEKSIYIRTNLGMIYEELKEYKMALNIYQKIIEIYPKNTLDFLPKIAEMYVRLGDKEMAWKYYIQYEMSGGQRNEGLMEAIRQLK